MNKKQETESRASATKFIKSLVKKGDVVRTSVVRVSRSGMSRSIRVFVIKKNQILDISYHVAKITNHTPDHKNGGVKIGGCGMDMGFAIVYDLGRCLFPTGGKLPKGRLGRNGDRSGIETDGGYLLVHRQL